LFAEVFAVSVYAGFALGSVWFTLPVLVAGLTVPVLFTAILTPFALPPPGVAVEDVEELESER
jgi:hypothetical protein